MAGAQGGPGPSAQGEDPRVLHHPPADEPQAPDQTRAGPVPEAQRHRGAGVRPTRHPGHGPAPPTRAGGLPGRVDLREHRPQRPQVVAGGKAVSGKAHRERDALATWTEFTVISSFSATARYAAVPASHEASG